MAPDVVAVGAATVDRHYRVTNLPKRDGGAFARDVDTAFGGVAANVATGCALLTHEAGLIARLGTDSIGEEVLGELREGPVDATRVRQKAGTSTHCLVLRDPSGARSIVTAGDSTVRLRLAAADRQYLSEAAVVFVTAYAPDPVHESLLAWRRSGEIDRLVFDLSGPLAELEDRGATEETLDAMVEVADLFVVGDVAAGSYLDRTGQAAAAALGERWVSRAAVTSGPDGAILVTAGGDRVSIPAFDVAVADETGAGDAFVAGLIHAWLLEGREPAAAGRYAAAVAALNCRSEGARGGLPTASDVAAFLDSDPELV